MNRRCETVEYTLKVSNDGPDAAEKVVVTDDLPLGLEFAGAQTAGGETTNLENGFVANIGRLEPGASQTVTVTALVTAKQAGSIINVATVSSSTDDPNLVNNNAGTALSIEVPLEPEVIAPAKARLIVNAIATTCGNTVDLPEASYTINGIAHSGEIELDAGDYTLEPIALPGSSANARIKCQCKASFEK